MPGALRPVTVIEAFFKSLQTFLEKFGEFLREVAALVIVFIPIDYWKEKLDWTRMAAVSLGAIILFLTGYACDLVAIYVKRRRDQYEEEQGTWIRLKPSEE